MSFFENDAVQALISLLPTLWAEISPSKIFQLRQLSETSLSNLLSNGTLTPPFAIIELGNSVVQDWGIDNEVYRQEITIHYLASIGDPNSDTGVYDISGWMSSRLGILRESLVSGTSAFQLGGEWPEFIASGDTPIAKTLSASHFGLSICSLKFGILIGQMNS